MSAPSQSSVPLSLSWSLSLPLHRLLSGGLDYDIKFWDFAGMDSTFRSFRQVTPHDGHPVEQVRWSVTGDCFLVATGEHCAKLYDRDGHAQGEYQKGIIFFLVCVENS